jgi:hypothetical protein
MDSTCPAVAGYGHAHGNMALIVPRFKGRLGGEEASMFGLSCYGGEQWTELFLTAPEPLAELKKGDYVDAEIIVMPYGPPHAGFGPAERQRVLYGSKAQTSQAICGEKRADFPARFKADARGFAEFNVEHGADWTPLLVEGFKSHRAPMLWEELGGAWMLHDQQVRGNDWYQTYRAADGSIGFVFVVKLRPDMTHRYVVTQAPHATGVTTRNGFAVVEGGPMDFLSPVPFDGLDCQPVPDAPVYRCRGAAEQAVQSGGVTN